MANICVFCGGMDGVDEKFIDLSIVLGESIAKNKHTLLYGGGIYGLMGGVLKGITNFNGKKKGVIPQFLMQKERGEILSTADCEVIITETMAERLQIFFESSDIFFILSGGLGTLNEFIQALELKKHGKLNGKIYLVNIFGFYDQWIGQLDTIANEKFLPRKKMDTLFQVISDLEDIKIILHS